MKRFKGNSYVPSVYIMNKPKLEQGILRNVNKAKTRDADQDLEYREMRTTIRSTDYSREIQTTIRRTERCRPRLGVRRVKPRSGTQ